MIRRARSGGSFATALLVALLLLIACGSTDQVPDVQPGSSEREQAWVVGPQVVPPPAGASDVIRDSVADTPQPDVEMIRQFSPENDAEWRALIERMDEAKVANVSALAQRLSVSYTRAEIEGIPVYSLSPAELDPRHESHLFIYVHGGAYVLNAGEAGLEEAIAIAARAKMRVLSIDYRMPPEHPFPAGLDDVVTVYQQLLGQRPAPSIALGGTSAGGGLILATVSKLQRLGLETPGALYAGTPWTDLTKTGDSYFINEGIDRLLVVYEGFLQATAELYAGDHDLTDPLISPVYGSFEGFPPTFLVAGVRDLFLSNTARVHTALRAAGVVADLLVFEGVSHGDYLLEMDSPEFDLFVIELNEFLLQHLR